MVARESREACGWARALQSDTARPQCARARCSLFSSLFFFLSPFAGVPVSPASSTRFNEGQLVGRRGCATGGALVIESYISRSETVKD